jgi:hypothetical protein
MNAFDRIDHNECNTLSTTFKGQHIESTRYVNKDEESNLDPH